MLISAKHPSQVAQFSRRYRLCRPWDSLARWGRGNSRCSRSYPCHALGLASARCRPIRSVYAPGGLQQRSPLPQVGPTRNSKAFPDRIKELLRRLEKNRAIPRFYIPLMASPDSLIRVIRDRPRRWPNDDPAAQFLSPNPQPAWQGCRATSKVVGSWKCCPGWERKIVH